MKVELNDNNYQGILLRLTKGNVQQKIESLKKLNFLYENARSRIYLYERRITESLQLLLLMEEKDIANCTLSLLKKIIVNATIESDLYSIIKKRLLSKIVLNLGSVDITTRRISHKCILEYVCKFKDYESIIPCYIKTAFQQTENNHLKLKSINSFHSLVMEETKSFTHGNINVQVLLEELIQASHQKEYLEIRRASIICLIEILGLNGSDKTLKMISNIANKQLNDLKAENPQLAALLNSMIKQKHNVLELPKQIESEIDSAPSPKFMSITEQQLKKQLSQLPSDAYQLERDKGITQNQLKILNDVSFAEQFLKKLENSTSWQLAQIKQFAPHLEKYLVDESIKLFSISKKIIEVIFDSECQQQKEYYITLVPCVVNGIGNKRFIVRKHLGKLVRQYIKNHTGVWIGNFIQRMSHTQNNKIKEILIELFLHAYRTSPQFYHPYQQTFATMERQILDTYSNLKWKAVDCLIMVIQKQGKTETMKEEMMSTLSPQVYSKIMRKMNKTHNSIGSNESIQPNSPIHRPSLRDRRMIRLPTDNPRISAEKQDRDLFRKNNLSQQKIQPSSIPRQRKVRKSQAEIEFKMRKSKPLKEKQAEKFSEREQRTSITKLPELRRNNLALPSLSSFSSKLDFPSTNQSPVKKSMGERNIMYVDKENLPDIGDPKTELEKALVMIRDNSWNTQFQSVNSLRSVIEYHKQIISDESFATIISELLQCLSNLRSGVSKITLICLGQILKKFHKRSYPFTEQTITILIKKSLTTSDFIQQEIKKCLWITAQQLCPIRLIATLNSLKQNAKGSEFKVSILSMIDAISQRNQKLYKKEVQWIWNNLIQFHEDHNLAVKNEVRKVVKSIIQKYGKHWKDDISGLKIYTLEKIDRIIKTIIVSTNVHDKQYQRLETEDRELEKLIAAKTITPKYFTGELLKLEDFDKQHLQKKNFKERNRLLNNSFESALQYPNQFVQFSQWRRYFLIAIDHLDQKNPGMLLNSLQILSKCLESAVISNAITQDSQLIQLILEKLLISRYTKRLQMGQAIYKFMVSFYQAIGYDTCCKQLLKLHVAIINPNPGNIQANGAGSQLASILTSSDIILSNVIEILNDNSGPKDKKMEELENKESKQIKKRYEKLSESQEQNNHPNNLVLSFDCIDSALMKLINRITPDSTQNNKSPAGINLHKLREVFVLCSLVMSKKIYEKCLANPKAKQLLNYQKHYNKNSDQDQKNLNLKRSSAAKDLNPGYADGTNNRSQPKQRPSFQRTNIKSGDRKIRLVQNRRDPVQTTSNKKQRDISKQNEQDIRGSYS